MCGIAGIVHWGKRADAKDSVTAMTLALAHRGPDGSGQIDLPEVSFGHRRLSIIDLSNAAAQPMKDKNERYWITFNGEIYNFQELRKDLEGFGYVFQTRSDTEAILHAYDKWGTACVSKLTGMFAFAIWDLGKKELFIARDRFGKKPLYYSFDKNKCFSFASEISALLKDASIPRKMDPEGLNHYLALGYILAPKTHLSHVLKLPAATWMLLASNGEKVTSGLYWDYSTYFQTKVSFSESEVEQKVLDLFDVAIRRRLISDVPVGAFLSGGIDSAATVAMMKKYHSGELHTFSVGFNSLSYNESEAAAFSSKALGSIHHGKTLRQEDGLKLLEEAVQVFDEPFCDNSMIPMLFVSRLAAEKVKVVLSGDGADELFAGYITYKADRYYQKMKLFPRALFKMGLPLTAGNTHSSQKINFRYKLRQFLQGSMNDEELAHYSWRLFFTPEERVGILGERYRELVFDTDPSHIFKKHYAKVQGLNWLDKHLYVDGMTWLTDDILVKVDRTTMAAGLEARAPFLDHELAEFMASVPAEMKLNGSVTKYILKKSLQKVLPKEILNRKKSGFNAPVGDWIGVTEKDEFRTFNKFVFNKLGYAG